DLSRCNRVAFIRDHLVVDDFNVSLFDCGGNDEQQCPACNPSADFENVRLHWFNLRIQIHQHDHVEKQNHDCSGVDNDVHDTDKCCIKHKNIIGRNSKEG